MFLDSQHFGGRGAWWSSEMGLGRMTSGSIIHTDLHKPNNKLISVKLEHFLCTNKSWAYTDSQNSPQFELGGSHHLPPYSIICAWPQGQHPNVILLWDSQVGVPKFSKLRLLRLWKPIILCVDWGEVQGKVLSFVKTFPTICGMPPSRKEIKAIPDF